jgi:hypothetical protein
MSYRTLPIVALSLAALIAGPTLAVAGSCKDTKRTGNPGDISAGSAKTTVKNEMSDDTVLVEITRNGASRRASRPGSAGTPARRPWRFSSTRSRGRRGSRACTSRTSAAPTTMSKWS